MKTDKLIEAVLNGEDPDRIVEEKKLSKKRMKELDQLKWYSIVVALGSEESGTDPVDEKYTYVAYVHADSEEEAKKKYPIDSDWHYEHISPAGQFHSLWASMKNNEKMKFNDSFEMFIDRDDWEG